MKQIEGKVKAKMGTDDEPFEGEVPIAKVEDEITNIINASKNTGSNPRFLFDNYTHTTDAAFLKFV